MDKVTLGRSIKFTLNLLESWINYYHKKKKLHCVFLADLLFIIIISIVESVITSFIVNFLFAYFKIENKMSILFMFVTCVLILSFIAIQNLTDPKYNMVTKFKIICKSITMGFNKKDVVISFFSFIFTSSILCYLIIHIVDFDKIYLESGKSIQIIYILVFASLIITYIIYVYGINDLNKRNNRKIILYSISTLITVYSSLNLLKDFKTFELNSKVVAIMVSMIVSIDNFIKSCSWIIENNSPKNEKDTCLIEFCEEKGLTFDLIFKRTKKYYHKIKINIAYILKGLIELKFTGLLLLLICIIIPVIMLMISSQIDRVSSTMITNLFNSIKSISSINIILKVIIGLLFVLVLFYLIKSTAKKCIIQFEIIYKEFRIKHIYNLDYKKLSKSITLIIINFPICTSSIIFPFTYFHLISDKENYRIVKIIEYNEIIFIILLLVFFISNVIQKRYNDYKNK